MMRDFPQIECFTSAVHRAVAKPQIILFGSRLLGTQRKDSDVDLVVVSQSFHGIGLAERRKLLADAVDELNWHSIDIVKRSPAEWAREQEAWLKNTIDSQVHERDQWRRLIETYGRFAVLQTVNAKRQQSNEMWSMQEVGEQLAAMPPTLCPRCGQPAQGGCRRPCPQCGYSEGCS